MEEQEITLNEDVIAQEVDKITEAEEPESGSTPEKTSTKTEEPEGKETTEAEAPKTTEKELPEAKEDAKETLPDTVDDTRFDKNPRFQKIISERDDARQQISTLQEQVQTYESVKKQLEGFEIEELTSIKEAAKLLKQHPELNKKVSELINSYDYGNSALKAEIDSIKSQFQSQQEKAQTEAMLTKYDAMSEKLISEKGFTGRTATFVKNMLQDTVISKKIKSIDDVPKLFANIVKEVEEYHREILAGHVKTRDTKRVPATIKERDKVLTSKKDSAEQEDIIKEIASGLKADRAEIQTEE